MDIRKETFLEKMKKEAEQGIEEIRKDLEQRSEELEKTIGKGLTIQMEKLKEKYYKSSQEAPCHVVLSYLRSSLLDQYPMYLAAMYDEEFFFSREEWSVMWRIPELEEPFYEQMDKLAEGFARQTRVEGYYLDELLFFCGDQMHQWFMEHAPQIIRHHLMADGWREFYGEQGMCIWAGEYRHQIRRIFKWGR